MDEFVRIVGIAACGKPKGVTAGKVAGISSARKCKVLFLLASEFRSKAVINSGTGSCAGFIGIRIL